MSILLLQIEDWVFEVKNHEWGLQVAMIQPDQTTHYVRLDREQAESLRQFVNDAALPHTPQESASE